MLSIRSVSPGRGLRVVPIALAIVASSYLSGAFAQAMLPPPKRPIEETSPPPPTAFRSSVAEPLQQAEALIRAKKFDEALAKIRLTDAIADRTPTENVNIDRLRGVAAVGAGDIPTATRSFEAVLASGPLEPADRNRILEALAQLHYQARDFPKAASAASRYLSEGGSNPEMRLLLVRAQYFTGDCASASRELRALVDIQAKSGVAPAREPLQMLSSCYSKLGDDAGFAFTLDNLLTYYPTKEYWAESIRRVEGKPGFSDRNALDVLRLRHATGTFGGTDSYVAMTQRSMAAALPAEAKRIADEGFASGALGTGPGAEVQKGLRDAAAKQVIDDQKQLPASAKAAASASGGVALVNVGFAYVTGGQFDTGIPLMEQGIARGGLPRPDEAKLHLGIAYLSAGRKADAVRTFSEVRGTDGTAELARLWLIYAQRPSS